MKLHTRQGRAFAVLIIGIVLAAASLSPVYAGPVRAAAARIVCLSPGHGGSDTGAVNKQADPELREVDLNWAIAHNLEALLEPDYTVVYTHNSAADNPGNTERAEKCNAEGADTVLWIHLNSSSDPTVDYFKAFWGKKNKDEAFCKTLTTNFNLKRPDGVTPLPKQPVGQFASAVMLKATAPACLVENVFISNTEEGNMFRVQPGVREQQIAEQLNIGLRAWYASR